MLMSMEDSELENVKEEGVGLAGELGELALPDGEEGTSSCDCSLLEDAVSCGGELAAVAGLEHSETVVGASSGIEAGSDTVIPLSLTPLSH